MPPRMTRAALRNVNVVHEDADDATNVPLPSTPQYPGSRVERAPLGDITMATQEEAKILLEVNLDKPEKKAAKGKKAKAAKNEKPESDDKENMADVVVPEVVEDDTLSSVSSAVELACRDLLSSPESQEKRPMRDNRPITPPSKAARVARKKLSPKQTPRFDPEIHRTPEAAAGDRGKEDSFVDKIEARSPVKVIGMDLAATDGEVMEDDNRPTGTTLSVDDSFEAEILSRSPLKASPRIEDSIKAIDALEDAIEKIGKELPCLSDGTISPELTTKASAPTKSRPMSKKTVSTKATKPVVTKAKGAQQNKATKSTITPRPVTKPISPRISTARITPAKAAKPTPPTVKTPIKPNTSVKRTTSRPITMPVRSKARVSSVSKTPFIPQKSGKAPTKSTFTLPGEAISAKIKQQRAERQKREEAETSKRREFKAQPVRSTSSTNTVPIVKSTAASKARLSIIGKPVSPSHVRPRISSVGDATKPSAATAMGKRIPSKPVTKPINTRLAERRTSVQVPKIVGKDIFNRDQIDRETRDTERKSKEEAAKKARAEAAERGRQASRVWAEKMKVKEAGK